VSPSEVSCAAKAACSSTVIREFMPVNTENAVRPFGPSVNRQRTTFPTRLGGFALDRGNKVATSAHNRKRTKSLRSFSSVSKSCSENNRIPVGSQSSSEQAAIGIDRKALAPPPRIAGRASGVLTVGDFPLRSGCSRPNFLTKVGSACCESPRVAASVENSHQKSITGSLAQFAVAYFSCSRLFAMCSHCSVSR